MSTTVNKSTPAKVAISIAAGFLCILLSELHISLQGSVVQIDIPWTLLFPLVISFAYGIRYALISGIFGGAIYPFYLWPVNGWANVLSLIYILVLFVLVGIYSEYRNKNNRKYSLFKVKTVFILSYTLLLYVCIVWIYNFFLKMNPVSGSGEFANFYPRILLYQFFVKDGINFSLLVIFSDSLVKTNPVRRLLGLPIQSWMRNNTRIFVLSTLISTFIWAVIYVTGIILLPRELRIDSTYNTLSFFILFWSGGILGRVLIWYQELGLKSQDELLEEKNKVIESELKFRALFDNAPDMYLAISPNAVKVVVCNNTFLEKTGYERSEVVGSPITNYYSYPSDTDNRHISELLIANPNEIKDKELLIRKKDGGQIQVSLNVNSVKDGPGNISYYMLSLRDISLRLKAEKSLKQSEENFRLLVRNTFDGILISDPEGHYLYANKKAAEITGYSLEELLLLTTKQLTPVRQHSEVEKRIESQFKEGKELSHFEATLLQKSGNEILIEIAASITTWKGIPAQILSFRDITKRKQAEQELLFAKQKAVESDRLKSAFLANMSHEIRTPMNGILGFTSLLNEPGLSGEEQQQYIDIITKSGARMLDTVNDIIEISKIETGQVKVSFIEVDLNERIENLILFFNPEANSKGLELIYENVCVSSLIRTDENKLNSILTNLIKNALKFTEEGWVKIGCTQTADSIEISVTDTGIGIPFSRQEAVFNRFEQADIEDTNAFEGSGLGLAITKSYVEMLGGSIYLESVFGEGSTFKVTFPSDVLIIEKQKENTHINQSNKMGSNAKLNILIAEDDENSYLHLSILLNQYARNIIRKTNGADTVEYFKNNPDVDIILMDVKMPVMDGYQATREIRKFNSEVVIIAQTAYALEGDNLKALNAGCNDYITKPIKTEVLTSALNKYFNLN
ncbi:PAS domain S-box protein [uncultured Draconibacterium sp.]|uniref:PAS domain S-box protein n=1 Tax=uncultured Draconibacterium sp. TaxID=1573823 RepID=UPI003217DE89